MATLTWATQVAHPIVGRIMIKVRSGKHDMSCSHPNGLLQIRPTSDAPPPVAPRLPCLIVPSPVRQTAHSGAMRPAAALAYTGCSLKANAPAELTPRANRANHPGLVQASCVRTDSLARARLPLRVLRGLRPGPGTHELPGHP